MLQESELTGLSRSSLEAADADFRDVSSDTSTSLGGRELEFSTYAACYWPYHYSQISLPETQAKSDALLTQFVFDHNGACFDEWLDDIQALKPSLSRWDLLVQKLGAVQNPSRSSLFAASVFGLLPVLKVLYEHVSTRNQPLGYEGCNNNGASAVYLSARYGNIRSLEFLLNHGASVDSSGGYFGNPLQAAAFHGHGLAARLLLDHQASPCAPGRFSDALDAAILGGHEEAIILLLADKAIRGSCNLETALLKSSYAGHREAVGLIIDRAAFTEPVKFGQDSRTFLRWLSILP